MNKMQKFIDRNLIENGIIVYMKVSNNEKYYYYYFYFIINK